MLLLSTRWLHPRCDGAGSGALRAGAGVYVPAVQGQSQLSHRYVVTMYSVPSHCHLITLTCHVSVWWCSCILTFLKHSPDFKQNMFYVVVEIHCTVGKQVLVTEPPTHTPAPPQRLMTILLAIRSSFVRIYILALKFTCTSLSYL